MKGRLLAQKKSATKHAIWIKKRQKLPQCYIFIISIQSLCLEILAHPQMILLMKKMR